MHELSIAMRVVESLTETLADEPGEVRTVRLRIGKFSGVVPSAMEFAWEAACQDTRFANSVLMIEDVPIRIWCEKCAEEKTVSEGFSLRCPSCDSVSPGIVTGRELEIESVEMVPA